MNIRNLGHFDIVVAGAGPAGFCAAIAAARQGAKTALVEKYSMAGGVLTVLGNNCIDEFINPHKKGDRMIIKGIAWEFVTRLAHMGYAVIPDFNEDRPCDNCYGVGVNPVAAAKLLDDMLLEAGVRLFYSRPLIDVETEKDGVRTRVTGAIITTKDGPGRLTADFFIDATGDGDLCVWAGNPSETGDQEGNVQPGTLRYYLYGKPDSDAVKRGNLTFASNLQDGTLTDQDLLYGSNFNDVVNSNGDNKNHVFFNAADDDSRTSAEIDIRRRLVTMMDSMKSADTGVTISATAPETAPRESRRILCDTYLTAEDYISCKKFDDSVSYTHWFIDIHAAGDYSSKHIFLSSEDTPSIPLSAMTPKLLSNVYVAGRCISGDRAVISAVRVKASCMAMGQACGTAAAICVKSGLNCTRCVDIDAVKKALSDSGAIVP